MIRQSFSLHRFAPLAGGSDTAPTDIVITGEVCWNAATLAVAAHLSGSRFADIVWPAPVAKPGRQDLLWQHTCLEVFVAVPGLPAYREYNISPSGHWATYAFSDYRQRVQATPAVASPLPLQVDEQTPIQSNFSRADLAADLSFDVGLPEPYHQLPLQLSLTAVIELQSQELLYFALSHCGEKPDFHRRDSFVLTLSPVK